MEFANKIIQGDCREVMQNLPADSIAACITDPPYNYEFIGRQWDAEEIKRRVSRVQESKTLVKNIPYGSGLAGGVRNANWYKRNRENILEYEEWCYEWAVPLFRILKSGAFVLVFNSTRTNAHVQVALERAGFYARDVLVWRRHSGIPKGFNGKQMTERTGDNWDGWHSCLRNEWEAICVLQKPLINNYPETLATTGVGLMHAQNGDGNFASNIFEGISNRNKTEDTSVHCTVKPLDLMKKLIELVVPSDPKHVVLDPFAGSGTTLVAAQELERTYLGIELVPDYCDHINKRLSGTALRPKDTTVLARKPATLFD